MHFHLPFQEGSDAGAAGEGLATDREKPGNRGNMFICWVVNLRLPMGLVRISPPNPK